MQGWDFENNQYYLSFALKWFHFHWQLSLSLINTTHLHFNYNFHFSSAGKCCWLETNRILSIWERSSCTKEKHLPASTKLHFLRWFSKFIFRSDFQNRIFQSDFQRSFCVDQSVQVSVAESPDHLIALLNSSVLQVLLNFANRQKWDYKWVIMGYPWDINGDFF